MKKTIEDKAFQIFEGSEIYIVMKNVKGNPLGDSDGNNAMFAGILMDVDDVYYYLGTGDQVLAAIPKSEVATIFDRAIIDTMMDEQVDVPSGTEFQ